ncbi:MAG: hypothetical protein EA370_17110 [Wenzhouxiangella sp.]|nr:MAG: hypothetical protein EA370_17110 [Wenzhouxiangella sp.]
MFGLVLPAWAGDFESDEAAEVAEAFGDLFPASLAACPEGLPDHCVCGEFSNLTDLPMRYSRVLSCPHPVLEDVRNIKTFTADGALIDDIMMKSGWLHGAAISWHPNGTLEGIANYDEGQQIGFARAWHDNGAVFAEQQFRDGQPHGLEIRYSTTGEVERVIIWDHGQIDADETLRLSRKLGIESP